MPRSHNQVLRGARTSLVARLCRFKTTGYARSTRKVRLSKAKSHVLAIRSQRSMKVLPVAFLLSNEVRKLLWVDKGETLMWESGPWR